MSDEPQNITPDDEQAAAPEPDHGIQAGQRVKLHSEMAKAIIEVEVESVEGDRIVVWDYSDHHTNEPYKPTRKFSLRDYPISAVIK